MDFINPGARKCKGILKNRNRRRVNRKPVFIIIMNLKK